MDPFQFMPESMEKGYSEQYWEIEKLRIKKYKPKLIRMWFQLDWIEPVNDNNDPFVMNAQGFSVDNVRMESVNRILQFLKEEDIDVILVMGWKRDVPQWDWLTYPSSKDESAPSNVDEWTEGISYTLNYFLNTQGYSNIKAIHTFNEVNGNEMLVPEGTDKQAFYMNLLQSLHDRLVEDGLRDRVQLLAPDESGRALQWVMSSEKNKDEIIDAYSSHAYRMDDERVGGWLEERANILRPSGKKLYVSEFGAPNSDTYESRESFDYGIKLSEVILAGLNNDVTKAMSFWRSHEQYLVSPRAYNANAISKPGLQALGLWRWLPDDLQPRYVYYAFSLLSTMIDKGSDIVFSSSDDSTIRTAGIVSGADYTFIVLNKDAENAKDVALQFSDTINVPLYRYVYSDTVVRDGNLSIIQWDKQFSGGNLDTVTDVIPAGSLIVYTTKTTPAQASIAPADGVTLQAGQTQQFTASLQGATGTVAWSVYGAGSISPSGLYTAPGLVDEPSTALIRAALTTDPSIYNLTMVKLAPENTDTVAPANIADLEVSGYTSDSVTLQWTAPGDDAETGTVSGYKAAYSLYDIGMSNFYGSSQADVTPVPVAAGNTQTMTIEGLLPGATYHFAVRAYDESGNWSVIGDSSQVAHQTLPPMLEDFEDGQAQGWASSGGTWSVADTGTSWVYRQSDSASYSRAVYDSRDWRDVTAKASFAYQSAASDASFGLIGRYQDGGNYYMFKYDVSNARLQLQKRVSNTVTTLSEIPLVLNPDTFYDLTFDMRGTRLLGYVNGELQLSARDESLYEGKSGLLLNKLAGEVDDFLLSNSLGDMELLQAVPGDDHVELSFTEVNGASGYTVLYGEKSGVYTDSLSIDAAFVNAQYDSVTVDIPGLKNNNTYFFRIRPENSLGPGMQSNERGAMTRSPLLSDSFEDGDASDWKVDSGDWTVASDNGNQVLQLPTAGAYRKILAGEYDWNNYAVSVDFQLNAVPSEGSYVDIITSYVDKGNYNLLRFDPIANKLSFLNRSNGITLTFKSASLSGPLDSGIAHNMKIVQSENRVALYFDGQFVSSIMHVLPAGSGRVGLQAHMLPVSFDQFVVAPMEQPYRLTEDDFESNQASAWQSLSGSWQIEEQAGNHVYKQTQAGAVTARSVIGSDEWRNYRVSAQLAINQAATTGTIGLLAGFQDDQNYYLLRYNFNLELLELIKKVNGTTTVLDQSDALVEWDEAHRFALEIVAGKVTGYVDGMIRVQETDASLDSGRAGLTTYGVQAQFDDVEVEGSVSSKQRPLAYDDFDQGMSELWSESGGDWTLTSQVDGASYEQQDLSANTARSVMADQTWEDVEAEAVVRVNSFQAPALVGIMTRYADENNYYLLRYNFNLSKLELVRRLNGTTTVLSSKNMSFDISEDHLFKFRLKGDELVAYVDGEEKLRTEDASLTGGTIGLLTYHAAAGFDEVYVKSLLQPPRITSLTAQDSAIVVHFTEVPEADRYSVLVGTSLSGPYAERYVSVTDSTYRIEGLLNDTTYYVRVTAVNDQGESTASNEWNITPRLPLLSDSFEEATLSPWDIESGAWQLAGQSAQTVGTAEAVMTSGKRVWWNYSLEASVMKGQAGTGDNKVALLGRYQSNDTYYRLEYDDSAEQLALYAVVDGTATLLDSVPYAMSSTESVKLGLKFEGDIIEAYVNDEEMLLVNDYSIRAGRFGLMSTMDGTQFDDVNVFEVITNK